MKTTILTLLTILGILAAVFVATSKPRPKSSVKIDFVVIDGCQYIVTPAAGDTSTITHKGNCTNITHLK